MRLVRWVGVASLVSAEPPALRIRKIIDSLVLKGHPPRLLGYEIPTLALATLQDTESMLTGNTGTVANVLIVAWVEIFV